MALGVLARKAKERQIAVLKEEVASAGAAHPLGERMALVASGGFDADAVVGTGDVLWTNFLQADLVENHPDTDVVDTDVDDDSDPRIDVTNAGCTCSGTGTPVGGPHSRQAPPRASESSFRKVYVDEMSTNFAELPA